MKKMLLLLIIPALFSCQKDEKAPELLVSATTFLGYNLVLCNISFLKSDQESVLLNEQSVGEYFAGSPERTAFMVDQHKEYLPAGDYIILVQIAHSIYPESVGSYSFKRISTLGGKASFENVMIFSPGASQKYQPWTELQFN